MPWSPDDIASVEIVDDYSEGDVVTIRVHTPAGVIEIMGSIEFSGPILIASEVHIQGLTPNALGMANLRVIAEVILERIDCDEARIEGAARTTGSRPGRRPGVLRFARRPRSAAG